MCRATNAISDGCSTVVLERYKWFGLMGWISPGGGRYRVLVILLILDLQKVS